MFTIFDIDHFDRQTLMTPLSMCSVMKLILLAAIAKKASETA